MRFVLLAILILVSAGTAGAGGRTSVHEACDFNYPQFVQLDTADGSTHLDRQAFWELEGRVVKRTGVIQIGTITVLDVDNRALQIDVYRRGRGWLLACDNGVTVRVAT